MKNFEPLLRKNMNKRSTLVYQSMNTINNIHIHSNPIEEKYNYHKTDDIPIIEQPSLSNSKFENNNFSKTPKRNEDAKENIRRVKKTSTFPLNK